MRNILVIAATLLATPALAAPSCDEIASSFRGLYAGFPAVVAGTPENLMTWRASCAETPPPGTDNVVALGQADTTDGEPVFYWLKEASSGFAGCA